MVAVLLLLLLLLQNTLPAPGEVCCFASKCLRSRRACCVYHAHVNHTPCAYHVGLVLPDPHLRPCISLC